MITIYDNYNLEENYDEVKEILMEEAEEVTDDAVWERIYLEDQCNWEIVSEELFSYMESHTCIMYGTVGRWNGTFSGGNVGEFKELFYDIRKDCDYVKIYESRGHLRIQCSHHDGTNYVEVRFLTDKGAELYEEWESGDLPLWDNLTEQEVHEKLIKNYSRLPHFCKKYLGCKEVA